MDIKHFPQEYEGKYKFNGALVMTKGFSNKFGDIAPLVGVEALKLVYALVNSPTGADYLQVFEYQGIKFWMIDDVDHMTLLLPDEY